MRWADRITGMILLVLAVLLGHEAVRLEYWGADRVPGPGFFPFWLSVGLGVGGAGILLEGRRAAAAGGWFPGWDARRRLLILVSLTLLLVLCIKPLGMYLAVGLYFLSFLAIFQPGRWGMILPVAVGSPLALYLIFERWLTISMPRGFLGF